MKTWLVFLLLIAATSAFAQKDTMAPAFKRYPTLPPLQLILEDSVTKYTKADVPKKKPVLIMLFSPDCEHCQHEAEQFAAKNDSLKGIHIVMITTSPIYRMKEFAEKYGVKGLQNVVVAIDPYYLLPGFYNIRHYPFLALYDKKGDLITTVPGSVSISKLLSLFNSGKR